jgi:glyoxylase-like metal-dependent hydrolase (beta-lactamase superfamily II)
MSRRLCIYITNDPVYTENGYTIYFQEGGPCWILDPGLPPQARRILDHVRQKSLAIQAILLTHAHADHIAGIDEIRRAAGNVPVYLAHEEWPALSDPMENLSGLFGVGFATDVRDPLDLPAQSSLDIDGVPFSVLDTSGHSPGGRTFYSAELGLAFVGDALFLGSIGRVDFPHSDGPRLLRNIRTHLLSLPDDTRVLSGHGPETTIGHERATNPFIA